MSFLNGISGRNNELIQELATFQEKTNAVLVTVKDLIQYGFVRSPLFHCFVADRYGNSRLELEWMRTIKLVLAQIDCYFGPTLHKCQGLSTSLNKSISVTLAEAPS